MELAQKKSAIDLTDLAIAVVVLGLVVTVGASILLNVRDTNYQLAEGCNATAGNYSLCDSAWQLADDSATGLAEYGNWFEIIVIVGVAGVILSLIFMAFGRSDEQTAQNY